jgi:undecaprenyl-diphosphatase
MILDLVKAAFLGIVEGLTEYIPVSSTGHLLLLQHFFGFGDEDFGNTFAVLIQLGAILALLSIYFTKLLSIATGMFSDPKARRFVIGVLVAFLPAAIIGAAAHNFIKTVLFNPWIVCISLIVGAGVLLYVTLRRHHRVGHAVRRRPALGGRILVLPRHAHHGRRLRL